MGSYHLVHDKECFSCPIFSLFFSCWLYDVFCFSIFHALRFSCRSVVGYDEGSGGGNLVFQFFMIHMRYEIIGIKLVIVCMHVFPDLSNKMMILRDCALVPCFVFGSPTLDCSFFISDQQHWSRFLILVLLSCGSLGFSCFGLKLLCIFLVLNVRLLYIEHNSAQWCQ